MNTRTVIVNITTEGGELLDRLVLEVPEGNQFVSVRPVNYSMPGRDGEEVLNIGKG